MKFRMFTDVNGKSKIAVDVDRVVWVEEYAGHSALHMEIGSLIEVAEDFATVISRLNTIAL